LANAEAAKVTFGSPVGYADKFWQVGSLTPPGSCLCCGKEIDHADHLLMGPYERGPYRYVCKACWSLPFLFFPDKTLAACHECWIPPGARSHHHYRSTAPRGARIGPVQEALRRARAAGKPVNVISPRKRGIERRQWTFDRDWKILEELKVPCKTKSLKVARAPTEEHQRTDLMDSLAFRARPGRAQNRSVKSARVTNRTAQRVRPKP
jgi:hypothetical protein